MHEKYVVYLDVIFLINLCMDYLILWATAKFGQFRTNLGRLLASAIIGATYSLVVFMPEANYLLTVTIKFLFSVVMVYIAYQQLNWKIFLHALGYFYLVAFSMAGAMLAGIYFINRNADSYSLVHGFLAFLGNVKYTWLLAAIAAALLIARWGTLFIKRNFLRSFFRVPVIICFGENRLPVEALVDTGNQLRDPITGKPVIITEYGVIKPLLPPSVQAALGRKPEPDLQQLVNSLAGSPWAVRVHMIPFTSIGKNRGMLLGFRPDEIIVVTEDKPIRVREVIVGIYPQQLSPEGTYRALLHPAILQSAIGF